MEKLNKIDKIEQKLEKVRQKKSRLEEEERMLLRQKSECGSVDDSGDYLAYQGGRNNESLEWRKLDTSAIMYPLITDELYTNVYRLTAVLKVDVEESLLQEALDIVLPKFPLFNTRLRQGIYWYYLEENGAPAPTVVKEDSYPCQYINMAQNRNYLFRVYYFRKRIHLEVFHVLTDGMGASVFLQELVYQYLRLAVPGLSDKLSDTLSSDISLSTENRFLQNYEKKPLRPYRYEKAYKLNAPKLSNGKIGMVTGFVPVDTLKTAAKKYDASINEYLVAVLNYAIFENTRHQIEKNRPIITCVPVNLRPYFQSVLTSNFFANVFARYQPQSSEDTFEMILAEIRESLKDQITKEHLEDLYFRNISSADNLLSKSVPMVFKRPYLRTSYNHSVQGTTTTVSNIGQLSVKEEYASYIERFLLALAHSKGQELKLAVCSYQNGMALTFTSVLRSTAIVETFFRFLVKDEVPVALETNGVYYR